MPKEILRLVERGALRGQIDTRFTDSLTGTGSQRLVWHPHIHGLCLNISGGGRKSWVIQGRIDGKARRLPLAEYGIPVDEVEAKAREWRQAMIEGRNPLEEVRAEAEAARRSTAPTLDELIAEFLQVRGDKLKPSTVNIYTKTVRLWASDWGNRRIDTITPREVTERYQQIVRDKSPASANTWVSGIRSVLNYAVGMEYLDRNPCDVLKNLRLYEATPSRTNVISPEKLPELWSLLDARISSGDVIFPGMVQFVLLTGCRRSEVGDMRWSEVDLDRGLWTLPAGREKSGRGRAYPLTPKLTELLRRQEEITERVNRRAPRQAANDLVWFTRWTDLRPKKRKIQGWSHATHGIGDALGEHFTWHDLRRTAASQMAVNPDIQEAMRKTILGHSMQGDVTLASYTSFGIEDVRKAMMSHEEWMLRLARAGQSKTVSVGDAELRARREQWHQLEDRLVARLSEAADRADELQEMVIGSKAE